MRYPKIGIRPVIDGRWGGVRESLEEQTMGMANAAAKLISENVCYPDGTPVIPQSAAAQKLQNAKSSFQVKMLLQHFL